MASIGFVLHRIKRDPMQLLQHLPVRQVCLDLGLSFRRRCLDPATTVALMIRQIIDGNSSCAGVRHHGRRRFSAQAYCAARQRLPLAVLQALSRRVCDAAREQGAAELFLTHRVFVIDGSSFSMPDTPSLQQEFGQSPNAREGCGFPVAHLLALFDAGSGMLVHAIPSPLRTHDLSRAAHMHPLLRGGDLLLGDTAFASYAHFAQLLQAKLHALTPSQQCRIVDFTPGRVFVRDGDDDAKGRPRSRWIKSLGHQDQLVEWFKPDHCPAYLTAQQYDALPNSITVRELRRRVWRPELKRQVELTLITTLLDEQTYPAEKLVQLYLRRWQAEIDLRHLKTTMGLEVLKCKTPDGVRKELAAFTLVYNLLRLLMLEAAARQKTHPQRISFADVLAWVRVANDAAPMPRFIINPKRRGRLEPRACKRRPKPFARLTRPRAETRKALQTQGTKH